MAAVTNTLTDKISLNYSGNGQTVSSKVGTYTGSFDAGIAKVIAAGATNSQIDIVFPHSTIQALIIDSDQDVTVKVNSTTTPVPSLTIKANAAVVWGTNFANACPLTADVTTMYVTNATAVDARFNVRVLYN